MIVLAVQSFTVSCHKAILVEHILRPRKVFAVHTVGISIIGTLINLALDYQTPTGCSIKVFCQAVYALLEKLS